MLVLLNGRIAARIGHGWGLAGFCPGPALVSLDSGQEKAALFVAAMLGRMLLYTLISPAGNRSG
jgi:uncharacterized membrane protein YedE/YeeE